MKAITQAIQLLKAAPLIYLNPPDMPAGNYRIIHDEDVETNIAALTRADARTRIDPSKRAKRGAKKKATKARR